MRGIVKRRPDITTFSLEAFAVRGSDFPSVRQSPKEHGFIGTNRYIEQTKMHTMQRRTFPSGYGDKLKFWHNVNYITR